MTRLWDDQLLDAYLAYGRQRYSGEPAAELDWAFDRLNEVLWESAPNEAVGLVIALVDRTPIELADYVAAGPLEDILCRHGPKIIDAILLKLENPHWRRIVAGVWRRDMDSDVWIRLQAAIGRGGAKS